MVSDEFTVQQSRWCLQMRRLSTRNAVNGTPRRFHDAVSIRLQHLGFPPAEFEAA